MNDKIKKEFETLMKCGDDCLDTKKYITAGELFAKAEELLLIVKLLLINPLLGRVFICKMVAMPSLLIPSLRVIKE